MKLTILFFGRFCALSTQREWDVPEDIKNTEQLTAWLASDMPELSELLSHAGAHIALNQTIIQGPAPISTGDEIAYMSAMSGG